MSIHYSKVNSDCNFCQIYMYTYVFMYMFNFSHNLQACNHMKSGVFHSIKYHWQYILYLQLMCGNNEMHFSQSPPKMVVPINQVRRTIYILEHTVSVCVLKRLCGLLSTFQPRDFRCNLQVFAAFATQYMYVCASLFLTHVNAI